MNSRVDKFLTNCFKCFKQDSKKYSDKEALEEISSKFGASYLNLLKIFLMLK